MTQEAKQNKWKTIRKRILWSILGTLAAILLLAGIAILFIDSITKTVIEIYASRVTGTKVSIGKLDFSIKEGRAEIRDLVIANPKNKKFPFKSPCLFRLGHALINVDADSIRAKKPVFEEILLSDIQINQDVSTEDRNNNNFQMVLNHVMKQFPQEEKTGGGANETAAATVKKDNGESVPETTSAGTMPVQIKKFQIRDVTFGLYLDGVRTHDVKLQMCDIGLSEGRIKIDHLIVSNPMGRPINYASSCILDSGSIVFDVDPKSFGKKKLVLNEVTAKNTELNVEAAIRIPKVKSLSDLLDVIPLEDIIALTEKNQKNNLQKLADNYAACNLQQLMGNLSKMSSSPEKTDATHSADTPSGAKPAEENELRLQVDHLEMKEVSLNLYFNGIQKGVGIMIGVDPIGPLGTDPEGISPLEFSLDVVQALWISSADQYKNMLLDIVPKGKITIKAKDLSKILDVFDNKRKNK